MAKTITNKDRALAFLETASEPEIRGMIDTATLLLRVRFAAPADKPKRGRPAGVKTKPTAEIDPDL